MSQWGEAHVYGEEMQSVTLSNRRSAAATGTGAAKNNSKLKLVSVPAHGSGDAAMSRKPTATATATVTKSVSGAPAKSLNTPTTPRKPTRDIREVWIEYKKHKTEPLRNMLMENYLHLVRYNAERIHVKLPDEVELDDLMSSGIFGLMDAINAFDLDRGVKFETYCAPRIRGAILDELRSMDWVPRLVRSRAHKLDSAIKQYEVEKGCAPTGDEIAKMLKVPMSEYEKMAKDASAVGLISLSRKWFETDSNKDVREIDVLEDKRGADPIREIQRKDLKELITKGLSRAERLIIILYYFDDMTMKEIGATLDLSESRVSQMHSSILARLKAQMANRKKELQQVTAE
jgi:RNA polymerase sigma factor for flagellar operon FliA